eukprot:scaffold109651_cov53-Attheya_sp.AAC.6
MRLYETVAGLFYDIRVDPIRSWVKVERGARRSRQFIVCSLVGSDLSVFSTAHRAPRTAHAVRGSKVQPPQPARWPTAFWSDCAG